MKVLHTSDWHLGRSLYGRKRYQEFESFLKWLTQTIQQYEINTLLVAGDIFDSTAPSHHAQQLYYSWLCHVAASCCRHVVIVAGNHDSPSFLDAPKELLKALHVHVVGSTTASLQDEVLVLRNNQHIPELIVCAVPYLRDRDIRVTEAGESVEDKERKLMDGIGAHYAAVAAIAQQKRAQLESDIPIVAMGHLFTAGGQTVDGDGVRELYVGSLAHVTSGIFPKCFDYVALGHLHVPQKVNGMETIRYSGSPLPIGFGEANQQKSVVIVDLRRAPDQLQQSETKSQSFQSHITVVTVPVFQKLERVCGDWNSIARQIRELSQMHGADKPAPWLEVVYDGTEMISDLRERLQAAIAGTALEILRIKNNRVINRVLRQIDDHETLSELSVNDVFERCLASHQVPPQQRSELFQTYQETMNLVLEGNVKDI